MKQERRGRWESIIQAKASEYLNSNSDTSSLITVTRVELDEKGKVAHVLLSILPETRESQAIAFAKRHERDIRRELEREHSGFVPFISCELDRGEKNRLRIDELSGDSYDS
jgi:ribosome-binding factor A